MSKDNQDFRTIQKVHEEMSVLGIMLWLTGTYRIYKDGNRVFSAVFRVWHPITWILIVGMVIPCAIMGEPLFEAIPMRLDKFWRANRNQLQWVTPWTKISELKPFNSKIAVRETDDVCTGAYE